MKPRVQKHASFLRLVTLMSQAGHIYYLQRVLGYESLSASVHGGFFWTLQLFVYSTLQRMKSLAQ